MSMEICEYIRTDDISRKMCCGQNGLNVGSDQYYHCMTKPKENHVIVWLRGLCDMRFSGECP